MEAVAPASLKSFKTAFAQASVGLAITDLEGHFVEVNDAYTRITGYSRNELLSTDALSITHPDYRKSSQSMIRRLVEGDVSSFVLQKEYIRKGGDLIWVQNSVSLHKDNPNVPTNIIRLCEDITERKVIQTALRESEERFRMQFKATPVPIFSWRRVGDDFVLVDYNDAAERLTSHGIIKLLGRRASQLYETKPVVIEGLQTCFAEQRTIRRAGEFRLLATGELKYLDVSFVYVPPNLVMIHTEDISERIAAETARRVAERKYRDIFENANEGIFQTTPDGRFLTANPALARILGFESPEQLLRERTDIAEQQYVDPNRRKQLQAMLETESVVLGFEYEAYRRDGSRIQMSASVRTVRNEAGEILYYEGITEEITKRKRVENANRNFSRRLIEAQENERKHIARELHDEIGQVLAAVRISVQSLAEVGHPSALSKINESIQVICEAQGRVRDLSFELRPSLLDDLGLAAATRWYVTRYAKRAGIKANVVIDFEITDTRLPRDVETACFRIIQEALTNVARHAQAKHVTVSLQNPSNLLELSVKDDGIGMDDYPFQEKGNPLNTLGLRGMEERALAVSGRLEIASEKTCGTEIKAYFPVSIR